MWILQNNWIFNDFLQYELLVGTNVSVNIWMFFRDVLFQVIAPLEGWKQQRFLSFQLGFPAVEMILTGLEKA